ncbi:MAG: hypothetical protein OXC28_07130 [Defluviicoccus sp.]|nr:hypothetical protein [Defluviicoccus sp.]
MSAAPDFTFAAVEAVRGRIAAGDTGFRSVESTLEAARNRAPRTPAAIVYPLADDAGENLGGRATAVQRVTARLAVLHIVAAPNDPQGAKARAELGLLVGAIRALLLGWTPDGAAAPLRLVGGSLEDVVDGRVFWSDRYAVDWVLDAQG